MIRRLIFVCVLVIGCCVAGVAQQPISELSDSLQTSINEVKTIEVDTVFADKKTDKSMLKKTEIDKLGMVIVGKDTISVVLPGKDRSRFDRGLYNYLFLPKGKWGLGLTASYGEFDTEDVDVLAILNNFNFKGSTFSINPSAMYAFRHNHVAGVKLGYSKNSLKLESLSLDIDEDLSFSLKDVEYASNSYSAAIFYRYYVGLDNNRRFAIFNETDLSLAGGHGKFLRYYDGEPRDTRTTTTEVSLNFSPGVCVFMHEYVSLNLSFGVFGLYFKNEKQTTNNEEVGKRFSSGANFRFNIFNINMGIAIHI